MGSDEQQLGMPRPFERLPCGVDDDALRADVVVLRSPLRPVTVSILVALAVVNAVLPGLGNPVFSLLFLLAGYMQLQFRTELRAGEAVLCAGLGTRRIPWSAVLDVRPLRGLFGIRRAALITSRGPVRLPVPTRQPLMSEERFRRTGSLVYSWWRDRAESP